jgi:hypothetical protein
VINWAMISLAHMKFRRAKQQQGRHRFPALFYPLGNWVCLLFMAAVLVIMLMTPGMAISVWLIPVWIAVLGVGYLFKQKAAATIKHNNTSHQYSLCSAPSRDGRRALLSASHFPPAFLSISSTRSCNVFPSIAANNSLHTATEPHMADNRLSIKEKIGYGMGMPDAISSLAPSCCLLTIFIPIFSVWRRRWWAYCCPCASSMR